MERHENVKLSDQERQFLVLLLFLFLYVESPHLVGTTNSTRPNLPVVTINIPVSFVCSYKQHHRRNQQNNSRYIGKSHRNYYT